MALQVVSARLPSGDTIVQGVTVEPYVVVRRADATNTCTAEDVPEEGSDSQSRFALRFRWYRSVVNRGGAVCWVHGDREATLQCVLCLRAKVDVRKSFHCSTDCLRRHWGLHKELHGQSGRFSYASENGFQSSDKSFKTGHTFSNNGETWIEVGRSRLYTPQAEDVGSVLKLDVVSCDTSGGYAREVGRTFSVRSERVRPAPQPPSRSMVQLQPPKGKPLASGARFTLLTYNLLADLYATTEQFPYCPPWVLGWQYRKQNLLKELLAYSADILCLQEVQSTHFADFWAPELGKAGYTAIFKKKTAEVYTNNAYAIDGCATFFKRSRFSLVKKYEVEFNKAALSLSDNIAPDQKKAALSRLLKDNVALIAVLEAVQPPQPPQPEGSTSSVKRQLLCIANTHIHANPELNDVKLWQVHTLVKGLEKIAASADIPMLVAGDFNSTPGSAAHSLLTKHAVEAGHAELSQDPLGILRPASKLQHGLPLASAYAALSESPAARTDAPALARQRRRCDSKTGEPKFTNVTRDFKGTLDYIMYTSDSLAPTGLLELPEEADVKPRPSAGLPNDTWSSDHIALMASFAYRQGAATG